MANLKIGSTGDEVKKLQESLGFTGKDVDGIFGQKTQRAVMDYQKANNLDVDGIVGANTWGALNKAQSEAAGNTTATAPTQTATESTGFKYEPYQKSDVVAQAEAMLQQQLAQKPGSYTSAWQTQLDETLNKILNREEFSYDLNGDALYQQYKDQAMLQGQQASMDVMGQAAAMTGGYGNSYAQQVGQQTYQGYLQQLNDRVPELYQLALDQYNRKGDELYNQASLMASKEEQDYGRYRDQVGDYYTELDRLANDARYQGEQDYSKWADKLNLDYGMYRDQVADKQWQAEFDEAKRQYDQQYALSAGKSSGGSTGGPNGDDTTGYTGGDYDNEGLNENAIKMIQLSLDIEADGKWGPQSKAAAGGIGAKEAYDLWNKGKLGKSVNQQIFDARKEGTPTASDYADWDQGDWEHYFSAIRQSDGKAAAEEELNEFAKKGLIPQNLLYYARIGASGKLGH